MCSNPVALSYKLLITPLFTYTGWCDPICVCLYRPYLCVCFLYTVDKILPSLSTSNKQSKKGSLPSFSNSTVNLIGLTLLTEAGV